MVFITTSQERLPSGPIEMIPTDTPIESSRENSSEEVSKMIKYVTNSPYPATTVKKSLPADQQALCRSLSKMRITPERVTKVTKERVYSVAVHPSRDKVLVCVGDRGGRLGLWDVVSIRQTNKHSYIVHVLFFINYCRNFIGLLV